MVVNSLCHELENHNRKTCCINNNWAQQTDVSLPRQAWFPWLKESHSSIVRSCVDCLNHGVAFSKPFGSLRSKAKCPWSLPNLGPSLPLVGKVLSGCQEVQNGRHSQGSSWWKPWVPSLQISMYHISFYGTRHHSTVLPPLKVNALPPTCGKCHMNIWNACNTHITI